MINPLAFLNSLTSLNKKLLRDSWQIKEQLTAIILVMAAGIAVFVTMFGVLDSLKLTRDTYYDRYQFADVFASLKRAPVSVKQQINEIPGVSISQSRVVFGVTLQMPGMDEPGSGKIISLPDNHAPLLNQLYLRAGRLLYANEENAILADESFFQAHQLSLGDKVPLIINGHRRDLKIVGVVLSPEHVYSIAPGALMPDGKRYGIFWMSRRSLEAAVNMQGAFNDLTLKVGRNANQAKIKHALDNILKPYGGLIAYGRDQQVSSFFVENELKQLQAMGLMVPIIFLGVAAFLVNVVMSRQIALQRQQIGMLKAVGYSNAQIAWHYLKMVLLITAFGSLIGLWLGNWIGGGMTRMYTEFFHFPLLKYHFSADVMIFAVLFCASAAISGTLFAIVNAAKLPPAQAMRPPSPPAFTRSLLERLGLHAQLSFTSKMILRQLERRPIRALLSTFAMAFALCLLIFSFFMADTMGYLMTIQYELTQREDLNITFVKPVPYRALEEIKVMPGVLMVEPLRQIPVYLKSGHYKKRVAITALTKNPELYRAIDAQLQSLPMPDSGLLINQKLADILHLKVGDRVSVEVLDEKRQTLEIPITAISQEFIGMGVFIKLAALNRLLDDSPKITGALIMLDPNHSVTIYQKLKDIPSIISLNITSVIRRIFEQILAESLLMMVGIISLFASFISVGVIYNTARIALSERGQELASLRVLGLTPVEVGTILFGELTLITLASLPLGIWLGQWLAGGMVSSMDSELYRIPLYISNSTYAYGAAIVLLSTLLSFYLVWRQVTRIDLVSAQKGVE